MRSVVPTTGKTLEADEKIDMFIQKKQLTLQFKVLLQWKSLAK